ncbi:Myb-like DNA-binding domain [Carpediemonas membranifera]|uniref:Myb-like DNA-binding domain n=1 Tax=Carpediemonas membranifera TaxID=201153 RepID=A0A8J6ATX9_9EUKA|nr:Myb-like DNA-binding domain [Carpediemonas membranifera]|eukprot:KAG9394048.1 Myb-like DNA-binding domain [Carpediemonas membranifera]
MQCCDCTDFSLCINCYLAGVEVQRHKCSHTMYPRLSFPDKFVNDWTTDEELFMIEALELNGLGNWELIRAHVNPRRSVRECFEHYLRLYYHGGPLANEEAIATLQQLGPGKDQEIIEGLFNRDLGELPVALPVEPPLGELPSTDPLPEQPPAPEPKDGEKEKGPTRVPHEYVQGYWPLRGDFNVEYDDNAEEGIANINIDVTKDSLASLNTKIVIINLFNERLRIREEKKRIVQLGGLVYKEQHGKLQHLLATGAKDMLVPPERVMPFFRYSLDDEVPGKTYFDLLEGLQKESTLRMEIARLQNWRLHGITKKADGTTFDAEYKSKKVPKKTGRGRGRGRGGRGGRSRGKKNTMATPASTRPVEAPVQTAPATAPPAMVRTRAVDDDVDMDGDDIM